QALRDQLFLRMETLRRHRHRNREIIAEQVAHHHTGRTDPERMLLTIKRHPGFAHRFELLEQIVEPRHRGCSSPLEARADQPRDRDLVELGEIGLAIRRAIERKGLANGRHGTQPMRPDDLVDENEMVFLYGREIDRLIELVREPDQKRARKRDEVGACRGRQPQNGRAQANSPGRRSGDEQLFRRQRGDDALYRRAGESDPLGDLTEAQAGRLLLERPQDRRSAGDDLDLAFVLTPLFARFASHPRSTLLLHAGLLKRLRLRPASLPAGSPIDTLQPEYGTENNGGEQPRSSMVKKIALEEHFLCPGFEDYWKLTVGDVDPAIYSQVVGRLSDFGELRLAAMDRAGIARSVLSLAGPGVQVEPDAKIACRKARDANDFLAREIEKRPDRYYGFAHLPMQDARAAADELERCQRELKFCGAMINGHTNGQYLDHPSLQPFWDRAQALGAAIYIHPTDPVTPSRALD